MRIRFPAILLLILCLSACGTFQEQNQGKVQGISLPFYEKTTWSVPVFDKSRTVKDSNGFYDIHLHLLKLMLDGDIRAYRSDSFQNPYDLKALKGRGRISNYQGAQASLDDPTYRKKFKAEIDQQRFFKYRVTQKWQWHEDQYGEFRWLGLTPIFQPTAGGTSLGEQPLAYLKYEEIADALDSRKLDALNQLLKKAMLQKVEGEPKGNRLMRTIAYKPPDSATPPGALEKMVEHAHLTLYDSAKNGAIKAYRDVKLQNAMTPAEVGRRGGSEEQIQRSPYLKDMGQKSVFIPLDPLKVRQYGILDHFEDRGGGRYLVKSKAFAPINPDQEDSDTGNPAPLFWVKGAALENALPPYKAEWLRKYAFLTLQRPLVRVSGTIAH